MNNKREYLSNIFNYYLYQFWIDFGDKRVKKFKMFSDGPYILLIILFIYLALVTKIIPHLMKSRRALKLQIIIQCYNVLLVAINGFFFITALRSLNYGLELLDLSIPSDEETSPQIDHEMKIYYLYLMTKFIDLLETVFFALRKKDTQISFLHLYHHNLIAILAWIAFWFRFNMKPNKLFILINSFIHTIMYSYYTLSTMGPKVHKYLWWKKYLTQLQLVQFVILGIYGIFVKLLNIPYPEPLYYFAQLNTPIFFYMFFDFYINSYKSNVHKKT
jgi:hypothetical protein